MLFSIIVSLAGLSIVSLWHDVLAYNPPPSTVVSAPTSIDSAEAGMGVPIRISIPNLAIDAAIENVTLAADGSMDVPKLPSDTGWYQPGPRPGEIGSAVIDGHVNWKYGASAVFANLHKIKPGDTIEVQDDSGKVVTFVVRTSRQYDAAADATEVFNSNDGLAHLNLITCDGVWDTLQKSYSHRLVVFADKRGS